MNVTSISNPFSYALSRARKGEPVTIAFFGGSITWGGNCSDIETKSYRALTGAWIRKQLQPSRVTCVNGGFGGTSSFQGAYRLEEQLLSHKPHMIFIEFAINDSGMAQSTMMAAHEAIFRKIWRRDPKTGVVLLISGSRYDSQAELLTKQIASDFGLYCVDVGSAWRKLFRTGKARTEELLIGDVHPTDRGHELYAAQIVRFLSSLQSAAPSRVKSPQLPKRFLYWRTPEYLHARLVPAAKCLARGKGWRLTEDHHRRFDGVYPEIATWPDRTTWPFPYRHGLMVTSTPGDSLAYTGLIRHTGVAVDYVPPGCKFEARLDGKTIATIEHQQKEEEDPRFPRVPEFPGLQDGKRHTLEIVLIQGTIKIGYLMVS